MVDEVSARLGDQPAGAWDHLIVELQALRRSAGDPSFAEIARRISEHRTAQGVPEHAARIARSSVHDAFRLGRTRINLPLVREIVTALGADPSVVSEWVAPAPQPEPEPEPVPAPPGWQVVALMAACVALNIFGRLFVDLLHLPIYLDMVGTAIAAIALGPWRGALVGGTTNLVGVLISGLVSIPFALVNIVGALVWGYGVRRFGFGRTLPRFFVLNLIVAVCCTLVAVPILMALGGSVHQGQDLITDSFQEFSNTLLVAVGLANTLTSLADKVLTGFVALVVISALPLSMRAGLDLVLTGPEPDRPSGRP